MCVCICDTQVAIPNMVQIVADRVIQAFVCCWAFLRYEVTSHFR